MSELIQNATIKSVQLTNDDFGCLTIWVDLDYGGAGQGFGGFNLYSNRIKIKKIMQAYLYGDC